VVNSTRSWDIFCKVIDNYGDIGVCWRLSADLASRGHRVRLWVDEPQALAWMAPGALSGAVAGVQVLPWEQMQVAATLAGLTPADVWVEGFGCEPEPGFVAHRFRAAAPDDGVQAPAPLWINLEYLSAEPFAARSHGLPSPIQHGPAQGHMRWFFYPGLTASTGGLLREPGLERRWAAFDRQAWLAAQGIDAAGGHLVSLFCYEPAALGALLERWRHGPDTTCLLVTAGRAAAAVGAALGAAPAGQVRSGALSVVFLPRLPQQDFDHLLWACDLNFVRGEDSLVRALWAGRAFVWQIYPQGDDAHHAKLDAVLDALELPASLRQCHRVWNGIDTAPLPALDPGPWGQAVLGARLRLTQQTDLTTRLLQFADKLAGGVRQAPKKS
jgi:uncharacterized repeat protein (TIGR03837 family)